MIENHLVCYGVIRFPFGENVFKNASVVAQIPARWQMYPSYMHSFALTENYYIVIEQPLSISMVESLKAKFLKRPLASIFEWYKNESTIFHVIRRDGNGDRYTFRSYPFFYLHTINAYEDNDNIVIDICCYQDPSVLDCMYVEAMENMHFIKNYSKMFRSRPLRFNFPLSKATEPNRLSFSQRLKTFLSSLLITSIEKFLLKEQSISAHFVPMSFNEEFWRNFESRYSVKNLINAKNTNCRAYHLEDGMIFCIPESLCDLGCETPRINDKKNSGKKYRFFYAISSDVDAEIPGTVRAFSIYSVENFSLFIMNRRFGLFFYINKGILPIID